VSVPYANTISGLVKKRAELCGESQILRGKLAAAQNAIESIDRVLETLGYDAPSDGRPPRGTRIIFFDRNELRRFLMDELREAKAPLSSREIAGKIIVFDGKDPLDKKLLGDMVDRVGKGLRLLRRQGIARGRPDRLGLMRWSLVRQSSDPAP
jgi:hypothetical protein